MSSDDKLDGINGIINLAGIVPTRAKFIGEAFITTTLSSLTLGVTCGLVGSALLPTGPVIPFLFGSWLGNSFGLWYHYRNGYNNTMRVARLYPTVLAHTMMTTHDIDIPQEVIQAGSNGSSNPPNDAGNDDNNNNESTTKHPTLGLDEWIRTASYKVIGIAILSTQDCRSDIEEIDRYRRQQLVEAYQEKYSLRKNNEDDE